MSTKRVKPDKIDDEVMKALDKFYQGFNTDLTASAIDKTPVQGGNLRGSLRLSKGSPVIEDGTPDISGAATKQKAAQTAKKLKIKDDVSITAGADYAGAVEFGTDDTRPNPYMRPAALESDRIAKKVAKEL